MDEKQYKVLSQVNYPADIRKLDISDLKQLCCDIREYLVDTISETGGHLFWCLPVNKKHNQRHRSFFGFHIPKEKKR